MSIKWFVQIEESVEGPLTTDEVQYRIQGGKLNSHNKIWSRGLESWMAVSAWNQDMPDMATVVTHMEAPSPEMWHFAHGGKSHGPYAKPQLVEELKNLDSLGEVMIWTKGMKEWAALFEFHDLLHAVGVNKRQFPRADLTGRAMIKTNENALIGQVMTISEGGCSIVVEQGLVPGQAFSLEIQSPGFRDPILAKAECRYISEGVAGVKFTNISAETKGAIIQFVKQGQTRFVLKAA